MRQRKHVALLVETSNSYSRGLLEGVIAYVREHESWSIYLPEQRRGERPPAWLSRWRGDGIIARVENRDIARAVRSTGAPVVDVSAARMLPDVPWVETDDEAIAQTAFNHLTERGFRQVAYCGDARFNWSKWRGQHFRRLAEAAGCRLWNYPRAAGTRAEGSWQCNRRALTAWVQRLPRPIGIMACYDIKAQEVLEVCRDLGISVPEEVAVLGVDDDHLICELCMPPLSSVAPDTRRTGYIAADLLDQRMRGRELSALAHLVKPLGVTTRRSTDVFAVDDPDVATALQLIREYACERIQVADIARNVSLSRRVLEVRFVKLLGRTPHEEIQRVKIDRVKRLLGESGLPLKTIARRAGFSSEEYMSVAFKRAEGVAPGAYRAGLHVLGGNPGS
ncbi:MAG: substrate-binding domain-containing protein [Planctomycetota bacterium]